MPTIIENGREREVTQEDLALVTPVLFLSNLTLPAIFDDSRHKPLRLDSSCRVTENLNTVSIGTFAF